jgi:hypothetical protein
MRSGHVIVLPPVINNFPGMKNIAESVLIQTFIPKAAIETLNKSILRWLTRLDKSQLYTMLKSLFIECTAGKFRALIGSYRC